MLKTVFILLCVCQVCHIRFVFYSVDLWKLADSKASSLLQLCLSS